MVHDNLSHRKHKSCANVHFWWLHFCGSCNDWTFVCACFTLAAWGEQATWTVLGFTPFAFGLLQSAKRLLRLPRSPLGREPLYLHVHTHTYEQNINTDRTIGRCCLSSFTIHWKNRHRGKRSRHVGVVLPCPLRPCEHTFTCLDYLYFWHCIPQPVSLTFELQFVATPTSQTITSAQLVLDVWAPQCSTSATEQVVVSLFVTIIWFSLVMMMIRW